MADASGARAEIEASDFVRSDAIDPMPSATKQIQSGDIDAGCRIVEQRCDIQGAREDWQAFKGHADAADWRACLLNCSLRRVRAMSSHSLAGRSSPLSLGCTR